MRTTVPALLAEIRAIPLLLVTETQIHFVRGLNPIAHLRAEGLAQVLKNLAGKRRHGDPQQLAMNANAVLLPGLRVKIGRFTLFAPIQQPAQTGIRMNSFHTPLRAGGR